MVHLLNPACPDSKAKQEQCNPCLPRLPRLPCSIPKDSAAYLTGVAPADGTGVKSGFAFI